MSPTPRTGQPEPPAPPAPPQTAIADAGTQRGLDGEAFIFAQPTTPPSLWGRGSEILWSPGESLMICGPDSVGKTTIAQQLILGRLGVLARLLDATIEPAASAVLYLAMDRPSQAARSMRRMVDRDTHGTLLRDRLRVWRGPLPVNPLAAAAVLADWIQSVYPETTDVVIDSLKDAIPKVADDEQGARWNQARQELLARGLQVVELHHMRKEQRGTGKPNTLADVYGSRWLTAGAGSVLIVWGDAGDTLVDLHHAKQPVDMFGPHKLIHDHEHGRTTLHDPADLLETLRRYDKHGLTVADAAAYLHPSDTSPGRNDIERTRRKLKKLVSEGHATETIDTETGLARYHPRVTPVTPSVTPLTPHTDTSQTAQPSRTHTTRSTRTRGSHGSPYEIGDRDPNREGLETVRDVLTTDDIETLLERHADTAGATE